MGLTFTDEVVRNLVHSRGGILEIRNVASDLDGEDVEFLNAEGIWSPRVPAVAGLVLH